MRKNARCRIGNLKNTQKHFLILIMGAIYHTARSENCVLRRIFICILERRGDCRLNGKLPWNG